MHQFENTNSYLIEKSLNGLYFGDKEQISDTLSVIPLITNNPSEAELLTLSEAYRDRLVEIEETGKVNRVTIRNLSNKALLLTNGEILEGAKQNRTLNDSTLLPSNGQFDIYTDTSLQGKDTQKQMDNGNELARQMLARKYQETQNSGFE